MFEAMRWAYTAEIENAGMKFVLVVLAEHASAEMGDDDWTAYPAIDRIAAFTAQGYRTVQRHIKALEDDGWIRTERRTRPDGTKGGFLFTMVRERNPGFQTKKLGVRQNGQTPEKTKPPAKNGADTCQIGHAEALTEGPQKEHRSSLRSDSPGFDPDLADDGYGDESDEMVQPLAGDDDRVVIPDVPAFERFWRAYPRKTAKGKAREGFDKAVKKQGADPEMLVRRAEDFAEAVRFWPEAERLRWTPHAATWLNQGRWDDDMEDVKRQHAGAVGKRTTQIAMVVAAARSLSDAE